MLRAGALLIVVVLALLTAVPLMTRAADDKQLERVKGVVGYQPSADAPFTAVLARFMLPDDYFAITREQAAALLALPDSSIVSLGANTRVRVGAFNQTSAGPGASVYVDSGALRFDIRRPQGGAANYHFLTATTQIAVRGTVGLLSLAGGSTTVACLTCAADSVLVTVGGRTFIVLTGQMLTVDANGVVVRGTLNSAILMEFAAAQVSTSSATGFAAAVAGLTTGRGGPVPIPAPQNTFLQFGPSQNFGTNHN